MYPTETKKSNVWLWLILVIVVIVLGFWFFKSSDTSMPTTKEASPTSMPVTEVSPAGIPSAATDTAATTTKY